ncbi:MAG TPA: ABC transporter substrate-binding protein [Streptosporangiaceae bacterium]|jgi:peptide/nickel transport system substrate-binding protein
MTRLRALAALAALAVLATAACTPGGGAPSPGPVTPRTLTVIGDASPVDDWDPATAGDGSSAALGDIYETLTRYDSTTHQVGPLLATQWEPNGDNTVWRFSLRDGVRFHSGRAVDAQAVRASILDSARRSPASVWHAVRSVATPNDGTVTVTLARPLPLADLAAADHGAFIYDVRAAGGTPAKDGGTGPYRVASWHPESATPLTLARVPGYWGGWKDGQFTGVAFAVEHDPAAAARRLRAHGSSIALHLTPGTWAGLRGEEGVQTSQVTSWQEMFALLDTHRLHDVRVRRAISYGVDGDGIVNAVRGALTKPAGVVPDGLYGHFVDLPMYPYDPARARSLLAKAGDGPGGKRLKLTLRYDHDAEAGDAARRMAKDLGRIGVGVKVEDAKPAVGGQDIAVVYRRPDGPDPYGLFADSFATGAPGNLGRYSSRTLDRLLAGARAASAADKDTAAQTYRQAQVALLGDAPAVLLGTTVYQRAFRTDFVGYDDDPAYPDAVFAYDLAARAG